MARSEEFRPLPRVKGLGTRYVGPGGEIVKEWQVRKLRASEGGYSSPKEMTAFRKSPIFREIIEKTAKHSNVTQDEVALDRAVVGDFRKAFVKPEGGFRKWREAEQVAPESVGNLLVDSGAITQQQRYLYFRPLESGIRIEKDEEGTHVYLE